ncbi:MAG: 50S ribosomal protein L1 [Methylacidiphilales bacterium]|nr:50S ribosomal protein L1 [Candidatus Methylacidiphilales bacterium]
MKRSKRYISAQSSINRETFYVLIDAIEILKKTPITKFNQSVDIAIVLGIDASKSEQTVRGAITLPHGVGKTKRVAVFAEGEHAHKASQAGADIVGTDDLAKSIKEGVFDFDILIAMPSTMKYVSTLGQILGPKGLMPNPKLGTVSNDVEIAVKNAKSGQAIFRNDKAGIIHTSVGKINFSSDKIVDNIKTLLSEIQKLKPSSSKGLFLQKLYVSATMSPSVRIDMSGLR